MHQPFTEPVSDVQDIKKPDFLDITFDALQSALNEARKKYNKLRNRSRSEAEFDLYCKIGLEYAVQYPTEWRKFYRNNVGEKCDYDKLNKLFYKFYKIQKKKLAKKQNWWHNI